MAKNINEKVIFGYAPRGAAADLIIGMPADAWAYCKDGKTHTLDLSSIGIPIRLMIFGAADHDAAKKVIDEHNSKLGLASLDARRQDFSIKP